MKKRFVFFGNGISVLSTILFQSLQKASETLDIDIVAAVDTNPLSKSEREIFHLKNSLKKMFSHDFEDELFNDTPFYKDITGDMPVFVSSDINENDFVRKLSYLNPDYAIVARCPQVFGSRLIGCFKKVINFQTSLLPDYCGTDSIQWAMYNEEPTTGFTYHHLRSDDNNGNILLQGKFSIDYQKSSTEVILDLTNYSANRMYHMLQLLLSGYDGYKPEGKGSYYSKRNRDQFLLVGDAMHVNLLENIEDIQKRIQIWGFVQIQYKGQAVNVTRIDSLGNIRRINHLPPFLFRFLFKPYQSRQMPASLYLLKMTV